MRVCMNFSKSLCRLRSVVKRAGVHLCSRLESGAEDARTPNADATYGGQNFARSVWSAVASAPLFVGVLSLLLSATGLRAAVIETDICVYGGTSGGAAAAVAAASNLLE